MVGVGIKQFHLYKANYCLFIAEVKVWFRSFSGSLCQEKNYPEQKNIICLFDVSVFESITKKILLLRNYPK